MSNPSKKSKLTRRAFIISGSLLGGGLALGLGGLAYIDHKKKQFSGDGFGESTALNPFIFIGSDNKIKLAVARAEMGQGVHHSMAVLTGEELNTNPSLIEVIHPQVEAIYANVNLATEFKRTSSSEGFHLMQKVAYVLPYIATGASTSVRDGYEHYRILGAQAREMLRSAAAIRWSTGIKNLTVADGFVIHQNGERLSFGELAAAAALIEPNERPELKPSTDFKWIGKPTQRIDLSSKVNGQAEFGIDVRLPGMRYAAIKHTPIKGANTIAITNTKQILGMPGVIKVVILENGGAAVANNTWNAKNAANLLQLELTNDNFKSVSSEDIDKEMLSKLEGEMQVTADRKGSVSKLFKDNTRHHDVTYEVPYLAHATMEPLNCTILVEENSAKVWVGQQAPFLALNAVSKITGVSKKNIEVNITYMGGGFGRRAEMDWVQETAHIAKELPGTPIQLVWTREEDIQNDTYRPPAKARMKAVISGQGEVLAWEHHNAIQSVLRSSLGRNFPIMTPPPSKDTSSSEGAINLPYDFKNSKMGFSLIENPIPVGFWRSVGHSINAFFVESFIDELAKSAEKDPYEFRAALLHNSSRHKAVLDKAADLSDWGKALPENHGRGIAIHESFGSIVAEVVELSNNSGDIKVHKVYCVIDCGLTVNPDAIKAQMEGGIVYGMTAAFFGEITISKGQIDQSNFPNYEMQRMNHMPEVITHIIESDAPPGGVGEPGTPPIAPALCNAVYDATGERIRKLPIKNSGYRLI